MNFHTLDTVDTRTLYRAFDTLRRAHRRLRRPLAYPDLGWLPYLDHLPGTYDRAVALCHLADLLRDRGHRDPYCIWSA
jgi:hypothetical protein